MGGDGKGRRAHGAGAVDVLPSGKVRVRVRMNGERISEVCSSVEEAEALRIALNSEKRTLAQMQEPEVLTLRKWGEKWLDEREVSGRIRNIAIERRNWKNHIVSAAFADLPLPEITRKMLREWARALVKRSARVMTTGGERKAQKTRSAGKTLARQTVLNIVNLLRKCFADAVQEEHLQDNPARDLPLPKATATHEGFTFLDTTEIDLVSTSPIIPAFERAIFLVAIYQGLRAGELWALRWEDIDLERGTMWIRRSHRGPTKSGKPRSIPLLDGAASALRALHAERRPELEDLVFPTEKGHQRLPGTDAGWSSRKVRGKPYVGFRERIGIKRRVRLHDLRHTCASHLVMGSWGKAWELSAVQAFLRHSSITVTQRYAHLSPHHLQSNAALSAKDNTPAIAVQMPSPAPNSSLGASLHDPVVWVTAEEENQRAVTLPGNLCGGRDRDRTCDQWCVKPLDNSADTTSYTPRDPSVTQEENAANLAVQVLRAVAAGRDSLDAVHALVASVLRANSPGSKAWMLALSVLEHSEHRASRAVELAEIVLDALVPAKARSVG